MQKEYDALLADVMSTDVHFARQDDVVDMLDSEWRRYAAKESRKYVKACRAVGLINDCVQIIVDYAVGLTLVNHRNTQLIRGEMLPNHISLVLRRRVRFSIPRNIVGENIYHQEIAALLMCVRYGIMPRMCRAFAWFQCHTIGHKHETNDHLQYITDWAAAHS